MLSGVEYVLEIKTANSASYAQLLKHGPKAWRSQYFDQIQCYMGISGIPRSILLVINKDSSDVFEELIEFDLLHFELLQQKARRLIQATEPPNRISESPMYYVCKQCQFKKVCHG